MKIITTTLWITIKKAFSLGIPQYNETEPLSQNTGEPIKKAVIKYWSHPSINT